MFLGRINRIAELKKAVQTGCIRDISGLVAIAVQVKSSVPAEMADGLLKGTHQALILPIIETACLRTNKPQQMFEIGGLDVWIRKTGVHFAHELVEIERGPLSSKENARGLAAGMNDMLDASKKANDISHSESVRRAVMKERGEQ